MEILILHKQGNSIRQIAKTLSISRNTVKKYLTATSENELIYKARGTKAIKLSAFINYIKQRVEAANPNWIPATVLFNELQAQGYTGGLSRLRWYLRTLKSAPQVEPLVRFETAPGEQMQVDWAEFKYGKQKISAFIATLGFSRYSYVEFVKDEKIDTLLQCHQNAFEFFGGVPNKILYDNMKTVVIKRDAYGKSQHKYQAKLWDYAKHMGFMPCLCKPYRAKTKGKVERFIGYLRRSFFNPLSARFKQNGLQLDQMAANIAVFEWLNDVANIRLHATTKEQPIKRLEVEKQKLQALPPLYGGFESSKEVQLHQCLPVDVARLYSNVSLQHSLSVYENIANTIY